MSFSKLRNAVKIKKGNDTIDAVETRGSSYIKPNANAKLINRNDKITVMTFP